MILYLASDLVWATKIKSTADALGVACRPARNGGMLRDRLADSDVRALLVDLEAGEEAIGLIRELRRLEVAGNCSGVRVVAFGPHVDVGAFERAEEAGADRTMARGAFAKALPELLRSLSEGG